MVQAYGNWPGLKFVDWIRTLNAVWVLKFVCFPQRYIMESTQQSDIIARHITYSWATLGLPVPALKNKITVLKMVQAFGKWPCKLSKVITTLYAAGHITYSQSILSLPITAIKICLKIVQANGGCKLSGCACFIILFFCQR